MCLVLILLTTILVLPSPPDTAPQQLTFTDRDVSEGCFGQLSWFQSRGRQRKKSRTPRGEISWNQVEIKLKSWEIKADFLEIKLGKPPNPPAPPTFTTYDIVFEGNHGEIKEKSGNLVRQNCSSPTPRFQ